MLLFFCCSRACAPKGLEEARTRETNQPQVSQAERGGRGGGLVTEGCACALGTKIIPFGDSSLLQPSHHRKDTQKSGDRWEELHTSPRAPSAACFSLPHPTVRLLEAELPHRHKPRAVCAWVSWSARASASLFLHHEHAYSESLTLTPLQLDGRCVSNIFCRQQHLTPAAFAEKVR